VQRLAKGALLTLSVYCHADSDDLHPHDDVLKQYLCRGGGLPYCVDNIEMSAIGIQRRNYDRKMFIPYISAIS
jgi:hypothetical protein